MLGAHLPPLSPTQTAAPAAPAAPPRRAALAALAAAAAAALPRPAAAAYGDAARVFGGKPTNTSGFVAFEGEGFRLDLPVRWSNPSRERPFPGTQHFFVDSGDFSNTIAILKLPTDKKSVAELGTLEEQLESVKFVLGDSSSFKSPTRSEGGFRPDQIAAASLLDAREYEKGGVTYRMWDVLTRTADGEEGGRHNLIVAAVGSGGGELTLLHVCVGDKRWFKGASVGAKGAADSFTVV